MLMPLCTDGHERVTEIMHLAEIYDLIVKLWERHELPAFLVGLLAGAILSPLLIRLARGNQRGLVGELRRQIDHLSASSRVLAEEGEGAQVQVEGLQRENSLLQEKVTHRDGQLESKQERLSATSEVCEGQAAQILELRSKLKLERKAFRDAKGLAGSYSAQLDDIAKSDGKIWLKATNGHTPTFVPLTMRRAAIISLANLKGGVGKTTLTANLGAALASQGLRVLLIDLDHQSSLTSICLTSQEQAEVKRSNHYIDDLFADGGDLTALNRCVTRLQTATGSGQLYLAPVQEDFADLENRLMTKWHSGLTSEDIRFRLRAALHSSRLRHHYDVVLIDCPPRLTTGSINALAASDYVLIPVLLEDASAEGVPRILGWLKRFRATLCADLGVLGIVGNKAYPRSKLITREQDVWNVLRVKSQEAWGEPVRLFDEVIREHSSVNGMFASLDSRHAPRYNNLIQLIRREIPHAHLQPSAVHPVAGAPLDGGGN